MTASTTPVSQAVILAGGQATRLRPYTDTRPKAMVEVAGRPIIDYQLEWLAGHGVEHVVVSCGYKAEVLQEHLSGRTDGPTVTLMTEDEPLGRGGALRFAASGLRDAESPYFALNGDILTWFPLREFTAHHRAKGGLATLALARFRTTWGVVDITDDDRIEGFTQSPVLPLWINAGVYLFEPGMTPLLPVKGDHESSTFPRLAEEGRLHGYRIDGFWRGVDTAKDVKEAGEEIRELQGGALTS
ncbi:nucleotidyltransferase family protein [Marinactinospora thermotolerans]|uniref:Nucleoside-diphosphate-sugar pyrophosphorylase involved in lipopolysaccharide biosynthesis/translation initiation factor 2B, gamma/epsilon subunits (eIF-2Bgamma/eIF-2Bepsilon) n=1 Tax=Marinactinospora thermotolerans DSM 45154 TaxID=1122192 RepID=A0A1T4SMU0_9ACTN|nr:nucleotidyltransferase family protein [Marinactinospora thermotolerans]SKA29495.1 Nucleoside-diphosphate-sugar pyrophosphorylase involved in lipopolysaccharide biosynthesis/translation initiation factor 2B, gamma/epsilon subunits (eIF-2Bgamma/eIF-2Bepsilon) [Marinactinospora thermotolerans DSM 45154]